MIISILTLFPDMFNGPFDYSIVKRAREKGLVKINFINIRDFATDRYKTVDDRPYGGGVGMLLRVDIVDRALAFAKTKFPARETETILLDPKGTTYTQALAKDLTAVEHLILVCGHYEGVDARVEKLVDQRISIGPYVVTGGEIPALVVIDSVVRLLPNVLAKSSATVNESFTKGALEPPQYTRPEIYKKMRVPQVLLSGNHKKIEDWRKIHAPKVRS